VARNKDAILDDVLPVGEPLPQRDRLLDEVCAIASLTAAVFSLLSLVSYRHGVPAANFGGRVGYELAHLNLQTVGLAGYGLPAAFTLLAVLVWRRDLAAVTPLRGIFSGVLLLDSAVLLALLLPLPPERPVDASGGWLGGFLAHQLRHAFGPQGSYLLTGSVLLLALMFVTRVSLESVAALARTNISELARRGRSYFGGLGSGFLARCRGAAAWLRGGLARTHLPEMPSLDMLIGRNPPNVKKEESAADADEGPLIVLSEEYVDEEQAVAPAAVDFDEEPPDIVVVPPPQPASAPRARKRKVEPRQGELRFGGDTRYDVPSLTFLDQSVRVGTRVDEELLRKSSQILEAKLADFGIEARVVEVRPGPVITTYDIEPAPGVKVNRIVSLGDDLSMALRVPGVRILAPVPGKPVVGIEVANPRREEVRLREMLESDAFRDSPSLLTMALGKDTGGHPVVGDLARMPHLLVAGATGSGKSVGLNSMIVSILYKAPPTEVRFVMIDMKMLELSVYEDIPHLLVPVVTDPKKAVVVLKNLVEQMDERYRLMKGLGVRNIEGYNRVIAHERSLGTAGTIELNEVVDDESSEVVAPAPPEPLPKVVVIIDELADLMMTMGRQVEEPITRLAQKARAAGIHLIVATQRPSVDVITGLIKANFPSRISFQTTTRVDSRTILDHIGAERLLGGGDMLYMPPGSGRLQRLHGPLVTEQEIHKIVDYIRKQGRPEYVLGLLENPDGDEDGGAGDEDLSDELYDQAVELVTESRQASISWLQRRLRVGYNRAARMIERMEREGVIAPGDGTSRPREVLAQKIPRD